MNKIHSRRKPFAVIGLALAMCAGPAVAAVYDADLPNNDLQISEQVKQTLLQDAKVVPTLPIEVKTYRGEVILSGEVESVPMVYRSVELARKIQGVRKVNVDALYVD